MCGKTPSAPEDPSATTSTALPCKRTSNDRTQRGYSPIGVCLALLSLVLVEYHAAGQDRGSTPPSWQGHRRLASAGNASGCDGSSAEEVTSGASQGNDHSSAFEPVAFFILAYVTSALAQQVILMLPKRIRMPHSVALFLMGLILARIGSMHADGSEFGRVIVNMMFIDPHVIFWILLPALLYEDASGVHWHVFKRVCPNALLLAVPGVILNTMLTGVFVKVTFGGIEWTWSKALLLGSVLSATDPVAVVGALHQLAAPDKLASLISGESLYNDGSAVVLFNLFWDLARGIREFDMGYGVLFFLRMALGGPLLALVVSLVTNAWLRRTESFNIEILVILVTIHGLFLLAEHPYIQVSGVLAVVCFGSYMAATGRYGLTVEKEREHHAIMSFMGLLSNEAIFLLAGIVSYRFGSGYKLEQMDSPITYRDYLECFALYVVIHITRAMVIIIFMPILKMSGYGLNWREATICVWGGLRGAVGLAMALLVEYDDRLDVATRTRIAFHTGGIVCGTLLVNGTTVTTLYKKLQIYSKAAHHDRLLEVAIQRVDESVHRHALHLKDHWFFHNCHLDLAMELLPLLSKSADYYQGGAHVQPTRPTRIRSRLRTTTTDVDAVVDTLAERSEKIEAEQHMAEKIICQFRSQHRSSLNNGHAFLLGPNGCQDPEREEEFGLALRIVAAEETPEEQQELHEIMVLRKQVRVSMSFSNSTRRSNMSSLPSPAESSVKNTFSLVSAISSAGRTIRGSMRLELPGLPSQPMGEPPPLDSVAVMPTASLRSQALQEVSEVPSETSSSGLMVGELIGQLARRRWQWASRRVLKAVRMMRQLREEAVANTNMQKNQKMKTARNKLGVAKFLEQCQEDEASMTEVFLTIVNAARATYRSMFRSQSLSHEPYRLLMDSLDLQEEVIYKAQKRKSLGRSQSNLNLGQSQGALRRNLTRTSSRFFSKGGSAAGSGFTEAWNSLRGILGRPSGFAFALITKLCPVEHWLDAKWWLLKRDAELVIAYVMTQEHLMTALEILSKFPDELQGPMQNITEVAKKQALFALVKKPYDSAMLVLFEHVLLARLLIRMQWQLVEQLEKEGALLEEDANDLIDRVIRPTEQALYHYTPTVAQLTKMGSTCVSAYTQNRFKRWLMWIVEKLEFHDAE